MIFKNPLNYETSFFKQLILQINYFFLFLKYVTVNKKLDKVL